MAWCFFRTHCMLMIYWLHRWFHMGWHWSHFRQRYRQWDLRWLGPRQKDQISWTGQRQNFWKHHDNGPQFCKKLRGRWSWRPVLFSGERQEIGSSMVRQGRGSSVHLWGWVTWWAQSVHDFMCHWNQISRILISWYRKILRQWRTDYPRQDLESRGRFSRHSL